MQNNYYHKFQYNNVEDIIYIQQLL